MSFSGDEKNGTAEMSGGDRVVVESPSHLLSKSVMFAGLFGWLGASQVHKIILLFINRLVDDIRILEYNIYNFLKGFNFNLFFT